MRTVIWLSLVVFTLYYVVNIEANRKVIYRGAQSYAGYKGDQNIQRRPPTSRRVDISNVPLHGARRNDPTYRQGLEELAGLM
ncbi:unnamed protein product [Schistosoma rodhaini]|uniref:Putative sj-Ts1 n=1 Tax=Schistosoma mansoni TaxID=6183 RepID=G4VLL6_SCHMA|nr:putative sj-Ts1 [Schistosoma mansoni]CAH8622516.1 unnamed protein product [Schistosoma rodhaini]|eukprot:XP_018652970.1 putative sj-Ts1 [Schistosoma mansoni]